MMDTDDENENDDDWDPNQGSEMDDIANPSNIEGQNRTQHDFSPSYDGFFSDYPGYDDGRETVASIDINGKKSSSFAASSSSILFDQDLNELDDDSNGSTTSHIDVNAPHSFYSEASLIQPPFLQSPTPVFSQLSQTSNLSVAELSRIEESLLSQSSHRDVEVERQRKKAERKRKRNLWSLVGRKQRKKYHLSEQQKKRMSDYHRFKYEKSIDISNEEDLGGSMEYLIRHKFKEPGEQLRLREIAKEREAQRIKKEREEQHEIEKSRYNSLWNMASETENDNHYDTLEEGSAHKKAPGHNSSSSTASKPQPNWNFLEEGYITMPKNQAKELPYYIFNMSNRKHGQGTIDRESHSMARYSNGLWLENCTYDTSPDKTKNVSTTNSLTTAHGKGEKEGVNGKSRSGFTARSHSFPLHFSELNPRIDLRSFSNMKSWGQDGMALLHGRMTKSMWARLVAGGVTSKILQGFYDNIPAKKSHTTKQEEPASDVSHSSRTSATDDSDIYGPSDYRSQYKSQTIFGSTSVIGIGCSSIVDYSKGKGLKSNPLLRLMSLVHTLPQFTHRSRLYIKIATELGALRQLWENEFRKWLDTREKNHLHTNKLSRAELWALKSFFGVDGNLSPGPFWLADPAMLTDPNKLFKRIKAIRFKIIPRLRRLMEGAKSSALPAELSSPPSEEIRQNENADGLMAPKPHHVGEDTPAKDSLKSQVHETSENTVLKDDLFNIDTDEHTVISAHSKDRMKSLSCSLLETMMRESDPDGFDKYAKVMHEANIDVTNIVISLSSFLDELTTSLGRSHHLTQIETLSFYQRAEHRVARDNAFLWNDTIDAYLSLAETLSRPLDFSIFKRDAKSPQCAPLAQSVMARQAYIANSGGILHKRNERHQYHASQGNIAKREVCYESDDLYEEANSLANESSEQKELLAIQLSARDITKRGKEFTTNETLSIFTNIHLTTGIAMLAEHLTPMTAEVVSRTCSADNIEGRTPFDLIRKVLVCLDSSKDLISSPLDEISRWNARGKVIDEIIVESWENAALLFRRCIEGEPHNVDNWTWYVATLLGIVCVSSGVSASSYDQGNFTASVKSEISSIKSEPKRCQLQFYDRCRTRASIAMKDFVKITELEGCPMFHMALSSMLEWRQAISLMHRPTSTHDTFGLEVRALHAFHTYKWAYKDCSDAAIDRVQALYDTNNIPLNYLLDVLARAVESDPSNTNHWYRLVDCLAATTAIPASKICSPDSTGEEEDGESWCQKYRDEWKDMFFHSPPHSTLMVKPEFVTMVLDAIDFELLVTNPMCVDDRYKKSPLPKGRDFTKSLQCCIDWIWTSKCDDTLQESLSYNLVDSTLLPTHASQVTATTCDFLDNKLLSKKMQEQLGKYPTCETLCLRAFVAYHILGGCDFVLNSVWWLALKHWKTNQQSNASNGYCIGLKWLCLQGLDVKKCLERKRIEMFASPTCNVHCYSHT